MCLCLTSNNSEKIALEFKQSQGQELRTESFCWIQCSKEWLCSSVMATSLTNFQLSVWAEPHQNNSAIQRLPFSSGTSVYMAYVHSTGCGHFISYTAVEGSFRAQHLLSCMIFSIQVTHKFGGLFNRGIRSYAVCLLNCFWRSSCSQNKCELPSL